MHGCLLWAVAVYTSALQDLICFRERLFGNYDSMPGVLLEHVHNIIGRQFENDDSLLSVQSNSTHNKPVLPGSCKRV